MQSCALAHIALKVYILPMVLLCERCAIGTFLCDTLYFTSKGDSELLQYLEISHDMRFKL